MQPDTLECGHGGNVDWEDTGCIPLYRHPVKTLTAEEIEDSYQLWRALSGDPEKLYQLFKLKEQEK